MCSVMIVRVSPKSCAICSCVSQTVSSSKRTFMEIFSSSVLNKIKSECFFTSFPFVGILIFFYFNVVKQNQINSCFSIYKRPNDKYFKSLHMLVFPKISILFFMQTFANRAGVYKPRLILSALRVFRVPLFRPRAKHISGRHAPR